MAANSFYLSMISHRSPSALRTRMIAVCWTICKSYPAVPAQSS